MSILRCGCGRFILEVKDEKDDEFTGECEECNTVHHGSYNKSSAWKEDPRIAKYHEEKNKPKLRAIK